MLCPKCKNPIEVNASECEWCGASFAAIETIEDDKQGKNNSIDAEIISLLKQGQKSQAIELYKKRTGADDYDCRYHVARLDFFLQHEHATESNWQNFVEKSKRKWLWSRWVQWILLVIVLFLGTALTVVPFAEGNFLFVFLVILATIFPTYLLINWMLKTKKI